MESTNPRGQAQRGSMNENAAPPRTTSSDNPIGNHVGGDEPAELTPRGDRFGSSTDRARAKGHRKVPCRRAQSWPNPGGQDDVDGARSACRELEISTAAARSASRSARSAAHRSRSESASRIGALAGT